MKSLHDVLYNWLTIKVVSDARPSDSAAKDTTDLFEEIMTTEYGVSDIDISKDESMYYISYTQAGESKKDRFPIELIEVMLNQINENPEKYKNYPKEK